MNRCSNSPAACPLARLCVLLVFLPAALCSFGSVALAQQPGAAQSESGTYLSLVWLVILCAVGVGWLYVTGWVSEDATGVGLPVRKWTGLFVLAGGVLIVLGFLFHPAVALLALPSVGGLFAYYVRERNAEVPWRFRIFSRTPAPVQQEAGGRFAAPPGEEPEDQKTELLNEKGESLQRVTEGQEVLVEAVTVLRNLVASACGAHASAVRVEPLPQGYAVLFNLDGVMRRVDTLASELGRRLVRTTARFLGLVGRGERHAELTVSLPGQGSVRIQVRGVRAKHGAAVVMSLPDWDADIYRSGLSGLGMHQAMEQRLDQLLGGARRSVLVSSPPESGKTSTFHALLGRIDIYTTDVSTLEAELEHELEHIDRHQVDLGSPAASQEAFSGLVRLEPDVVGVDELTNMRIGEPLFQFADQGRRLVLTTEAANACEAVAKLAEGVEGELVSRTLTCVLNQRLIRRLCERCKEPFKPSAGMLRKLKIDPREAGKWYRAEGCDECLGSGYRGRTGVFEMLIVNDNVREALSGGAASAEAIRKAAGPRGIHTLFQDALLKVRQGAISVQEVRRVLS